MTKKPDFFILAGPNGAGKTTNGHLFVPTSISIFNGDLVFAHLIQKYPDIEPIRLQGGVAKSLEDARDAALTAKKNFAFESNYSSDMATELTLQFKEAGYHTTLIYFGLDSLKTAASRVKERKSLGGHDVTAEVLKYNFEEGIIRVKKDLHLFDTILFVDSRYQNTRVIALIQKELNKQINLVEHIGWYDQYFKEPVDALKMSKQRSAKVIRHPSGGRGKGLH
jgi:predicted ABC-type ATPase